MVHLLFVFATAISCDDLVLDAFLAVVDFAFDLCMAKHQHVFGVRERNQRCNMKQTSVIMLLTAE